jgi:hypothetical protein
VIGNDKMLHLDRKPSIVFITGTVCAVMIDFIRRPACRLRFASSEVYPRGGPIGPWMGIHRCIGATKTQGVIGDICVSGKKFSSWMY